MKNIIQLNIPNLKGNEKRYIQNCIITNWISTSGKYIGKFEKKLCEFTKSKNAIACINGTAALQISLKIVGVKNEDEVIVPTLTFIAPVNAIKYNNAIPVFMDADQTHNFDINKTIDFIKNNTFFKKRFSYNKKSKRRISALIPVHVWGNAVNLEKLISLCKKKNIKIVEDASESLGTFYTEGKLKGKHTGTVGDVGCISFNGNKIITTGGGGVILTNNNSYAKKARYLISQAKNDTLNFVHNEIGYNFKLTNIHAAIGLGQLEKIDYYLKKKKEINNFYQKNIKNKKLFFLKSPKYAKNNYWMNILTIKNLKNDNKAKKLLKKFLKNKIESRYIWKLNHTQKPYNKYQKYKIKIAQNITHNSICLPSSTSLKKTDLKKIVKIINSY